MATPDKPPLDTTGDFEQPPNDDDVIENTKEVTWSATPQENERKTIEQRQMPVRYKISPHLSVKKVLKETHAMFLKTDSSFLMVSTQDSKIVIRNATDFDKFSADEMKRLFPATLVKKNTTLDTVFVTDRSIHRLKRDTFGFYEYASKHIYISKNPFLSHDVRNIGFFLRKSAEKVDKEQFTKMLSESLAEFPLSDAASARYNEAKEALPFDGPLPLFELRESNNIFHVNATGRVQTTAITVHCDAKHLAFMSRLLINFYEAPGRPNEQFVPHSLLHGNDPVNQKAYRNAIVLQNLYLTDLRILPVIGISPKALKQLIQFGDKGLITVYQFLLKYRLFSSIEPTGKSDELGMYFFVTTAALFDQAKVFIIHQVPKIWASLDNNFLNELPASVQVPRLTTSNLKDADTSKTAALLANATVPDDVTIVSKWSNAPQQNRPPTAAVIVNYSDKNFPALPSQRSRQKHTPKSQEQTPTQSHDNGQQIENSSTHSKASATSAGTNFTKEDGLSLFTSLTESFMSDIKSQSEAMMEMVKSQQIDRLEQKEEQRQQALERQQNLEEQRLAREEQRLTNERNDIRFMQLMEALTTGTSAPPPPPHPAPLTTVISPAAKHPPPTELSPTPNSPQQPNTQPMDTAVDRTTTTTTFIPSVPPPTDDWTPDPALSFENEQFAMDDYEPSHDQQQPNAMPTEDDSVASNSSHSNDLDTKSALQTYYDDAPATNGADADDEADWAQLGVGYDHDDADDDDARDARQARNEDQGADADDEDDDDEDDEEDSPSDSSSNNEAHHPSLDKDSTDDPTPPNNSNLADSRPEPSDTNPPTQQVPPLPDDHDDQQSYATMDSNDPTHEQYEQHLQQRTSPPSTVQSPPKLARSTDDQPRHAKPPEDIMDIQKRLYAQFPSTYPVPAGISVDKAPPTQTYPSTPTNSTNSQPHNTPMQEKDPGWTVETKNKRTPAESQEWLHTLSTRSLTALNPSKPTPPRSATRRAITKPKPKPAPGTSPKAPAKNN